MNTKLNELLTRAYYVQINWDYPEQLWL